MNIFQKLLKIQNEVKATKDLTNEFGHFNYRSAERIYNAVKPICEKYGAVLRVTDEVVEIGGKHFVKAIAELIDVEMQGEIYAISSVGWAGIPEQKKGLDFSQIVGSAESYANKYCVSALMLLDDVKDPDALPPDDKYEFAKDKEESMKRNKKRADAEENWRLLNGNEVEVKLRNGEWMKLSEMRLAWLELLLKDERFNDIQDFIQHNIDIIKGVEKV